MASTRGIRVRRSWLWPAVIGSLGVVIVTAGAAAAIETHTVASFWRGLWWSISLITTVGFIGEPPRTAVGAALSMVLMVLGFLLLAMVSASLASLFVREQDAPFEAREASTDERILERLAQIDVRLRSMEAHLEPHELSAEPNRTPAPDDVEPGPTIGT